LAVWSSLAAAVLVIALAGALYGESLKRRATWGAPVLHERFEDDGFRARWLPNTGQFDRRDGRVVSVGAGSNILVLDRRLHGAVAIDYEAEMVPGCHPCDLSLIWSRDIERSADGQRVERLIEPYFLQFGANNGAYSVIEVPSVGMLACSYVGPELGRRYRIRAEIVDERLTLAIDGTVVCTWSDPVRFDGGYISLYGYYTGKAFDDVRISVRGMPAEVPATALGDALVREGELDLACTQYRRVSDSHAGSALGDEARYKEGLCRWRQARDAEAEATWADLDGHHRDLARLHRVDRRFAAGDDGATLAELEAIAALGGELRLLAAMRWGRCVGELHHRRSVQRIPAYLDLRARAFAGLTAIDYIAAQAMIDLGREEEMLRSFPRQDMLAADALFRLKRFDELLAAYPEQIYHVGRAHLETGRFDADDAVHQPWLGARVKLLTGRVDDALTDPGLDDWMRVEGLCRLGRFDDALESAGADGNARAIVRHVRGDAATSFGPADAAHPLAILADGDIAAARAAAETAGDAVLTGLLSADLALSRWPRDGADALRDLVAVAPDDSDLVTRSVVALLPTFLEAVAGGAWSRFDQACEDAARERMIWQQRLWHDGAYLRGRIDDAAFLAQPCCEFAETRLLVCRAMRHERNDRRDAALTDYTAWLALPRWRRGWTPQPALERFVAMRVAALTAP
ncbi:MAG: hypothetical protein H0X45_15280, partial [Planctomycetes bacterium]|nr:hypothetical protein [Planctomycetota bacterium]